MVDVDVGLPQLVDDLLRSVGFPDHLPFLPEFTNILTGLFSGEQVTFFLVLKLRQVTNRSSLLASCLVKIELLVHVKLT